MDVESGPMTQKASNTATSDYLARHFTNAEGLGAPLGLSGAEVEALVDAGLAPQPSYVVADGRLASAAFGDLEGEELADGAYFHTGMARWLDQALAVGDQERLKAAFLAEADQARSALAAAGWAAPDPESATVWLEDLWRSHLAGVFGVCVRQPDRVDQIVLKETLQAILAERTDNGARADYGAEEAALIRDVVDRYAAACADFTPVEYPISSRRRYLEGLRLPPAR